MGKTDFCQLICLKPTQHGSSPDEEVIFLMRFQTAHDLGGLPSTRLPGRSIYHLCSNKGEWGDRLLSGSRGSVDSALAFQSLILSLIPGQKSFFLIPSSTILACVSYSICIPSSAAVCGSGSSCLGPWSCVTPSQPSSSPSL